MADKIRELIREYQKGQITRREFMRNAIAVTGSLATANTLINALMHSDLNAAQIDPNDPGLLSQNMEYKGKAGPVFGYISRPVATGKYPGIIVIHANQGINDHLCDVARRLAKQGYVALVPDYLSRRGGTTVVNPKREGLAKIRELAPW